MTFLELDRIELQLSQLARLEPTIKPAALRDHVSSLRRETLLVAQAVREVMKRLEDGHLELKRHGLCPCAEGYACQYAEALA